MKFLQIGDLHLGKKLYEFSLYDDQVFMLEKILEILQADDYDALLITGDIYEQSMPSKDAVKLFGGFLERLKKDLPKLAVFIISGNHDSPTRLAYASEILKEQNIFIQTEIDENYEPIIFKSKEESCAIFLLPFLQRSFLKDTEKKLRLISQLENMEEAVSILKSKIKTDMPNILLAHLFTLPNSDPRAKSLQASQSNDKKSENYLGSAQFIPSDLFECFDYAAFGHLHKMIKINARMYFAGSPFAYSFDEITSNDYEKYALSIEIDCKNKNQLPIVDKIPVPQLHRLQILRGEFSEFLSTDKFNKFREDYLQIELLNSSAVESAMQLLQKKFPNIMHIKQKSFENNFSNYKKDFSDEHLNEDNFEEIFKLFISEIESETNKDEIELATKFWEME